MQLSGRWQPPSQPPGVVQHPPSSPLDQVWWKTWEDQACTAFFWWGDIMSGISFFTSQDHRHFRGICPSTGWHLPLQGFLLFSYKGLYKVLPAGKYFEEIPPCSSLRVINSAGIWENLKCTSRTVCWGLYIRQRPLKIKGLLGVKC